MARSFVDALEQMIRDVQWNITQLQAAAADADLTRTQRYTIRDILYAEGRHLDVLKTSLRDWEEIR